MKCDFCDRELKEGDAMYQVQYGFYDAELDVMSSEGICNHYCVRCHKEIVSAKQQQIKQAVGIDSDNLILNKLLLKRGYLIALRNSAEDASIVRGLSRSWQRAYQRLADAADHLDAMWARCACDKAQA